MKELFNYGNSFGHLTVATLWKLESPKMTHPEDFALMFQKSFCYVTMIITYYYYYYYYYFCICFQKFAKLIFYRCTWSTRGGSSTVCPTDSRSRASTSSTSSGATSTYPAHPIRSTSKNNMLQQLLYRAVASAACKNCIFLRYFPQFLIA